MKRKLIHIGIILIFAMFAGIACQKSNIAIDITDSYKDICVPANNKVFFANTRRKHFSDEEILSFIQKLPGETSQLYSVYEMSKEEWQQIIDKAMAGNSFLTSVNSIQQRVNSSAKEDSIILPFAITDLSAGVLKEIYFLNNEKVSVCSIIRDGDMFTYFRDMHMIIVGEALCMDGILNDKQGNVNDYEHWLLPDNPDITRDDAFQIAQSYLNALGIDLDIFYEEPCTILNYGLIKSTGWKFIFTRNICGFKSQFGDGQWCIVDPNHLPVVGAPWEQEVCVITVDGDGLCQIWWQGATEVITVENSSGELYPFSTIRQGIDERIWSLFVDKDHVNLKLEVQITNVQLGIAMIAIDSYYEEGKYIPCWYIDFKHRWNYKNGNSSWENDQIVFSAIDGSYIEPRIKDAKLKELANQN